jgi:hypothetical protein
MVIDKPANCDSDNFPQGLEIEREIGRDGRLGVQETLGVGLSEFDIYVLLFTVVDGFVQIMLHSLQAHRIW